MKAEGIKRASYTLEYKLEEVRTGSGWSILRGDSQSLGMPSQTLENWVRQAAKGQLGMQEPSR